MLTAGAAIVAGAGATLFAAGSAPLAFAGTGTWMFASAAGAVSGIAALQALAPPPVRGLALSMIAFCNPLLGLGLGPSNKIGRASGRGRVGQYVLISVVACSIK